MRNMTRTPARKRKLDPPNPPNESQKNWSPLNLPKNPPKKPPRNEKASRNPKCWKEFTSIDGKYRLMEVRDFGLTFSSRGRRNKSGTKKKLPTLRPMPTLKQKVPTSLPTQKPTKAPPTIANPNTPRRKFVAARKVFENKSIESQRDGKHRDHPDLHRDHPDPQHEQADHRARIHRHLQTEPLPETSNPTFQIDGTPKKRRKLENNSKNISQLIKKGGGGENRKL
jgi:hypothetical protein